MIDPLLLERMGVPARYTGCTRATWKPLGKGDPWVHLDRWLADAAREWSVVLLGPTGSGKSHLGTALFAELLGRGIGNRCGWWIDAAEAIHKLREDLGRDPEERGVRMASKLHDRRPILIDDFLADRLTDFAHDEWVYSLGQRYNRHDPTIITSNAESLEAFDALDPRITSRLSCGPVIRLAGRDQRGFDEAGGDK